MVRSTAKQTDVPGQSGTQMGMNHKGTFWLLHDASFAHFNAENIMHPLKAIDISVSDGSLIKALIFTSDNTLHSERQWVDALTWLQSSWSHTQTNFETVVFWKVTLLHGTYTEYSSRMLWYVGTYITECTTSHPRRQHAVCFPHTASWCGYYCSCNG